MSKKILKLPAPIKPQGLIKDCNCTCKGNEYNLPIPIYPFKDEKGLNYDQWYEISRRYWLTIDDLLKMEIGHKYKILNLHRNTLDIVTSTNQINVPESPEIFFSDMKVWWARTQDVVVNQFDQDNQDIGSGNLAVDLYLNKKCMWYPLEDVGTKQCPRATMKPEGCRPWFDYPLNTYIGWRGPCIKWSNLKYLPKLYWTD